MRFLTLACAALSLEACAMISRNSAESDPLLSEHLVDPAKGGLGFESSNVEGSGGRCTYRPTVSEWDKSQREWPLECENHITGTVTMSLTEDGLMEALCFQMDLPLPIILVESDIKPSSLSCLPQNHERIS